jgi:hypothetical protein
MLQRFFSVPVVVRYPSENRAKAMGAVDNKNAGAGAPQNNGWYQVRVEK